MSYETALAVCQIAAMAIFGTVMAGILVHVLRPANRAYFDAASRVALRDDDETTEKPHGR